MGLVGRAFEHFTFHAFLAYKSLLHVSEELWVKWVQRKKWVKQCMWGISLLLLCYLYSNTNEIKFIFNFNFASASLMFTLQVNCY